MPGMKRQASAIRVVRSGRTRSPGGRIRFSVAAREAVLAHAQRRREQGASLATAAREAGVGYQTLRRWMGRASQAFRPVSVVAPEGVREIVVALPGGLRVEGLGLDDIVELARRLR